MIQNGHLTAKFTPKTSFLFEPARYKIMHGGRGSGKSIAAADYLLITGVAEKHRVLCTREVQKSIKDSVHKLLADRIAYLGLGAHYEVLEAIIRCRNGTEFLFNGLSNQTAGSLKSLAGVTKCWCEEAQTISRRSWDILIPTIREENSEFIITFNADLESDDTYQRFVINPPPGAQIQFINYKDNPFFPAVLEQERLHCLETNPDDYSNIWEGLPRVAATGAIYAREVSQAAIDNRICNLPYDPGLRVHTVWDMGFGDNMAVAFVQRLRSEVRIIDYLQVRQQRTDEVGALVRQKLYNYGYCFLPHDGFHTTRGTGLSDADILKRMGFRVKQTPRETVEDGIRNARNQFHRCYFDRTKTALLLECLKRYRRAETRHGGDGSPVHNEFSDGADCYRYVCLNLDRMTNEDDGSRIDNMAIPTFEVLTSGMGY